MVRNIKPGLSSGNWAIDFGKVGTEAREKRLDSKSTYIIETSREYRDVTEADIELRAKYGKSLVSNYTSTDKKLIRITKKESNQTLTMLNEVYYVYLGGKAYGKLAISIQRTFRGNSMTFILSRKKKGKG